MVFIEYKRRLSEYSSLSPILFLFSSISIIWILGRRSKSFGRISIEIFSRRPEKEFSRDLWRDKPYVPNILKCLNLKLYFPASFLKPSEFRYMKYVLVAGAPFLKTYRNFPYEMRCQPFFCHSAQISLKPNKKRHNNYKMLDFCIVYHLNSSVFW